MLRPCQATLAHPCRKFRAVFPLTAIWDTTILMAIRIVPDKDQPSAAIEIPLAKPLPDYDLDQMDQPTPREVDGILVSQGFRDLVDDARGVLTELLCNTGLEIAQFTGAICPGDDQVYRPGLWIVLKQKPAPANLSLSKETQVVLTGIAKKLVERLGLV
jgi:hypothetical protein